MITKEWKVSQVLEQYPDALDVFINASSHFLKLKNPVLRKVLATRVTVQQAAAIGGVALDALLRGLNEAIGEAYNAPPQTDEPTGEDKEAERINEVILETVAPDGEVELDVRPIISSGSDPLKVILKTVRELKEGEAFHLVNSFEPIPLYSVLGEKGFGHFTKRLNGAWHIYFYRRRVTEGSQQIAESGSQLTSDHSAINIPHSEIIELDVRGLAPPEPMMAILKKLAEVDAKMLLVHHHREPMLLYEKLEQLGFTAVSEKIRDDYFKVLIRKK